MSKTKKTQSIKTAAFLLALGSSSVLQGAAFINGSFETDSLGALSGPPTGWITGASSPAITTTYTIASAPVADGAKSLMLAFRPSADGFYFSNALERYLDPSSATSEFVVGEQYIVSFSLGQVSAGAQMRVKMFDFDATGFGFGNQVETSSPFTTSTTLDPFSLAFTYRGGALITQVEFTTPAGISGTTYSGYTDNFSVAPIPEPSSLGLVGVALGCIALTSRKRRN